MVLKIALAALVGALSGIIAAASPGLWPAAPGTPTFYAARTVAHLESAWHALKQRRSP